MRHATRSDLRSEPTGVQIEMTFRGIDPLDELVDAVRTHASALEGLCSETVVCRVGVHGIAPTERSPAPRYLVELRLTGRGGYCEVRSEGRDLFETLATTFARLEQRLRTPGSPGTIAAGRTHETTGRPALDPHDGWAPVRVRRADESMRDLPL